MEKEKDGAPLQQRMLSYTSYETRPDEALGLFEECLGECPVPYSEKQGGFHMFLKYEDVKRGHSDWATYSSTPSIQRPIVDRPPFIPIELDPPEHDRWRKLIKAAINPTTATRIEDQVRADAAELVEEMIAAGEFDVLTSLSEPLVLRALCYVFGLDRGKAPELHHMVSELMASIVDPERSGPATRRLEDFAVREVVARREDPRDDFLTELGRVEFDGRPLTREEIGGALASVMAAAQDTTVIGLTTAVYRVYSDAALKRCLLEDGSRIRTAVDEILRLQPPFFGFFRRATRDTECRGVDIDQGDAVFMCWAAANRDPDAFQNPDHLDVDRDYGTRRPMTFGWGVHACPGQPLARMEIRVALETLLERAPDLEITDPDAGVYEFAGGESCSLKTLKARIG